MLNLDNMLNVQNIIPALQSNQKEQVIRELLKCLTETGQIDNEQQAFQDVLAREGYLSTGMENGLAIPHAKSDAVNNLIVAFGIHQAGINFESLDGQPAHFVFLVLSPLDTSGPHIQALAQISRVMKKENIREQLISAKNSQTIKDILLK